MSSPADADRDPNEALLREGTEAYNHGDLGFVIEHAADDIEVFAHRELINTGVYRGREQFEAWLRNWQDAWSEITLEIRGVEAIGDKYLVVEAWQRAVGAGSGVPVEMEIVQLIEVREGKISRFHLYPDRESALAALEGLREGAEAGSAGER
jgi:ketosteroid isomerase-like protein